MSDLTELYSDLKDCLDTLTEQHKELLMLAEEQKEMILSRDSANLTIVVEKQDVVLQSVRKSEAERQKAVIGLATGLEMGSSDVSLRDLIQASAGNEKVGLTERLAAISRVVEELAIVNQINARLIGQARAFDDMLVKAITGESSSPKTYGPEGTHEKSASGISLIDREA